MTSEDPDLPRVLLLSAEVPHSAGAGAIILHRLFQNYPSDKLRVVTNHLPPAGATRLDCRHEHLPLAVDRLNRTRLWPYRAVLRTLGASSLCRLARIDALLDGFTPDVVVTVMQDSSFYDVAARYARARQLPLVLLVHDLAHGFEPVPGWLRGRQFARDRAVSRQAVSRLCVSAPMAKFFATEFGTPAEVLLPPRSEERFGQPPERCRTLKHPGRLTLGYAGGLHYGYGEQLLKMLPVLRATATVIELFGPKPGGSISSLAGATDVLHFNGYVSPPEAAWRELVSRCDAVLQPYLNPPGAHELQYRTHFPSKLGDCLSLGLPLLITGPDDASGLAWCLEHGSLAQCVMSPASADLKAALEQLRDSPELRERLATAAATAAVAFDAPHLREQLHASLCSVSQARHE